MERKIASAFITFDIGVFAGIVTAVATTSLDLLYDYLVIGAIILVLGLVFSLDQLTQRGLLGGPDDDTTEEGFAEMVKYLHISGLILIASGFLVNYGVEGKHMVTQSVIYATPFLLIGTVLGGRLYVAKRREPEYYPTLYQALMGVVFTVTIIVIFAYTLGAFILGVGG